MSFAVDGRGKTACPTEAAKSLTSPEPILLTAADIPEFISAAALTERVLWSVCARRRPT